MLVPFISAGCSFVGSEDHIATVDGQKLTRSEVEMNFFRSESDHLDNSEILQFVNDWVDRELLFQEAERQNIMFPQEMEKELEKIRKSMIVNIFLKERVDKILSVTEKEIKDYYDTHLADYTAETNYYKFKGIKTADRNFADILRKELTNGSDIINLYDQNGDMCKIVSLGKNYITEYIIPLGILNELTKNNTYNVFKRVTIKGEIYFLNLTGVIKRGEPKKFEIVNQDIRQSLLFRKREEKYNDLVSRLRKNNKFEINLEFLSDSVSSYQEDN